MICLIVVSLLISFFQSCDKNNASEDVPEVQADTIIADGNTVSLPATIIGNVPSAYKSAFEKRFTDISGTISSVTKIIISDQNSITNYSSQILSVLNNGGILIIVSPVYSALKNWLSDNSITAQINESLNNYQVFALSGKRDMFYGVVSEGDDPNEHFNTLVGWIKKIENLNTPIVGSSLNDSKDVVKLFNYQTVSFEYPVALEKTERQLAAGSSPDIIKGSGYISVSYDIYPLYVFEDQQEHGDYYIVTCTIDAHNESMYTAKVPIYRKHGGFYVRYCGFYLTQLRTKTSLVGGDGKEVGGFAIDGEPLPATTIGSTTFSSSLNWGISAAITGGFSNGMAGIGFTLDGGVSFSSSIERSVSDVDVKNDWSGSSALYTYKINNLPKYNSRKIKITDPPAISVNNVEFLQSWVWRVPTTKDNDLSGGFSLTNEVNPVYGSCSFITTNADFISHTWDDACTKNTGTISLANPYRTATGRLIISNTSSDNLHMTNIKIWRVENGAERLAANLTNSYPSGSDCKIDLQVGTYKVQMQMGKTTSELYTYNLPEKISIQRGKSKTFNAPFDFNKQ